MQISDTKFFFIFPQLGIVDDTHKKDKNQNTPVIIWIWVQPMGDNVAK